MSIHTEFKFHPQVTQIGCYWGEGSHTEMYLLEGDRLAIIDTGCSDTPEAYISPALERMGLNLASITLILNTHGHFDHAGGNAKVVEASGAKVWMPERDVAIAEDLTLQFQTYFAQNDTLVGRDDRLESSLATYKRQGDPTQVDRALKDGEMVSLGRGVDLRVVACPGHTLGSAAFYWEREGMLFTGDSVTGSGSRLGGLPLLYHPAEYEHSLDRLARIDINVLCLGHHYRSLTLTPESVKWGRSGKQFVCESVEIATVIADGMQRALSSQPDASFLQVASQAADIIGERLRLSLDSQTGLPIAGPTAALYANWKRFREG